MKFDLGMRRKNDRFKVGKLKLNFSEVGKQKEHKIG
jgi:hypothetical protein